MNNTQQVGGIHLPIDEQHMSKWMKDRNEIVDGRLTYQYHKLRAALVWVRNWAVGVDIGAHCGLWSMHLAKKFERLYAFEPVPLHRKCFDMNTVGRTNIMMIPVALGESDGMVRMRVTPTSSGDTTVGPAVDEGDEGAVRVMRLDDTLAGQEPLVGFIKLDCEGFELFALRGGEELIRRSHPCIIVEQKPGKAQQFGLRQTEAVDYLLGLGAKLRQEMSGDFIMSWDEEPPEPKNYSTTDHDINFEE